MRKSFDLTVYFVADPSLCAGRAIEAAEAVVREAVRGGVTLVQLRDKAGSKETLKKATQALLEILKPASVPLIINDYVDIVLETGAGGVHLGQDDMDAAEARRILGPEKIIGLTAFTEEQIRAVDPGVVDYIGLGPFYPTRTKKGKPVIGPRASGGNEAFSKLAALSPVPVVGIGGITAQNAGAVIEAGADGVAMMRSISEADDPAKAARKIYEAVQAARKKAA